MKAILKPLVLMLTMVILSQCKKEIEPNVVTIPDNNFLNALIELGVDTNGDGIISPAEAEVITFLDVSEDSISNMTGIEAFVYLDTLICSFNMLNSLDLSSNPALRFIDCNNNGLTSLDVSNCTALEHLACESTFGGKRNSLTSLNVSNNIALEYLSCGHNQLTSLNVANNTALNDLHCSGNQLTSLDVTNNNLLSRFDCSRNQLTELDVSNNTTLKSFYCYHNQLTSLDVSNNIALTILWCSGIQLSTLDLSNNTALGTDVIFCCTPLDISDIPSLYQVCVWEMPFPPAGVSVDTTDSPNVYFTTDCSK